MLKKIKYFTSILMVVALVMLCLAPSASAANALEDQKEAVKVQSTALYTMKGSQLSTSAAASLKSHGVTVSADTVIEIVPTKIARGHNALRVTNLNGITVETCEFIAFDADGEPKAAVQPAALRSISDYGVSDSIDLLFNGSLVFMWDVAYDRYGNQSRIFYRPTFVQMKCLNSGGHSVSYMVAQYICGGSPHTYPGFVDLGDNTGYGSEFTMIVETNNPVHNQYYYNMRGYPENRVIMVYPGAGYVWVDFCFIVNGSQYTTRELINVVDWG